MKHPLWRLLRLRGLLEEQMQLDLELRRSQMRRLETAVSDHEKRARAARGDALEHLAGGGDEWLLDSADAEILAWKSARLRLMAESRIPEVEEARAALLARRKERRQVESLVNRAAECEALEEARAEQKRVDDWYQSRATRQKPGDPTTLL